MDMNKICHKFRTMCLEAYFICTQFILNWFKGPFPNGSLGAEIFDRGILVTRLKCVDRDDDLQTSPVLLSMIGADEVWLCDSTTVITPTVFKAR